MLDPELLAAAPVYFDVVTRANAAANKAYEPIAVDTTLNVWRRQSAKIGRLTEGLIDSLRGEAWPTSVQPLVDAVIAANEDAADLWSNKFAKARNAKGVTSRYDDLDRVRAVVAAAGRELRFALGLPSNPALTPGAAPRARVAPRLRPQWT